MKVITNISMGPNRPGSVVEVPDNEAPGLLRLGYVSELPDQADEPEQAEQPKPKTRKRKSSSGRGSTSDNTDSEEESSEDTEPETEQTTKGSDE